LYWHVGGKVNGRWRKGGRGKGRAVMDRQIDRMIEDRQTDGQNGR